MKTIGFHHCRFILLLLSSLLLLLSACADLVVKEVNYDPSTPPNFVMKSTVKNEGQKIAGESITKLEYGYNWSDPFVEAARVTTPSLAPGESKELSLWSFSSNYLPQLGGCLHVRVCADANNGITELAETNNCLTMSFINSQYCRSCNLCCSQSLPQAFDWRNSNGTNWVTGVRDQANCGSCWAYSAVAAVESKNNVEKDASQQDPIDLSEQQLVSCPGGGGTCLGGWPSSALGFIRTTGIVSEATLPYTSTDCVNSVNNTLVCKSSCFSVTTPGCADPLLTMVQCAALVNPAPPGGLSSPIWRIGNLYPVSGSSVDSIKRALVCNGPLSVVSSEWRHAILMVGWDDDAIPWWTAYLTGWSRGAWIIKNSWGAGWGNNGYHNIPFSGHPFSDIANQAWYAQDVTRRP